MSLSKITIADLELHYHIGVGDEERANPQRILMTIEILSDFSSAIATDRITKTIDYFGVCQRLMRFGDGRSWKLIEKLSHDAGEMILSEFDAVSVTVTVKKFIIPQTAFVSVTHNVQRKATGNVKRAGWGSL
jgi:7,8-dihydroneopterin aldolase/epimerase/oxygenase